MSRISITLTWARLKSRQRLRYSSYGDEMDIAQSLLILALRIGLGLVLASVLSMLAVGMGWSIFVFSGASSLTGLIYFLLLAAGVAAGIGAFLAWLRVDSNPLLLSLVTVTLAMAAGFGGAWGGHEYGLNVKPACCVEPEIKPFTYAALGATVLANGAVVLVALVREIINRKPLPILRLFGNTAGTPR